MSSTWFKSLSALKVEIDWHGTGFTYTNYVLIAETAESNVVNNNGGHSYHKWIYACGEYDEIMRKVCRGACDFDNGMAKWKPNHKDSVGFIRMVKKALDEATEANELPYYLTGYVHFGGGIYDRFIELFENVEGIEKKKFYGENVLVAKDIKTYIRYKKKIENMIEHYKDSLIGRESFNDWLEYNKKDYITEIEVKGGANE